MQESLNLNTRTTSTLTQHRVAVLINAADSLRFRFADTDTAYPSTSEVMFDYFDSQRAPALFSKEALRAYDALIISSNALGDPHLLAFMETPNTAQTLEGAIGEGLGLLFLSQVRFSRSGGEVARLLPQTAGSLRFKMRPSHEEFTGFTPYRHLKATHSDVLTNPNVVSKSELKLGRTTQPGLPGAYWVYLDDFADEWRPIVSDERHDMRTLIVELRSDRKRVIVCSLLPDFHGMRFMMQNLLSRCCSAPNCAVLTTEKRNAAVELISDVFQRSAKFKMPEQQVALRAGLTAKAYDRVLFIGSKSTAIPRAVSAFSGVSKAFSIYRIYHEPGDDDNGVLSFDKNSASTRTAFALLIAKLQASTANSLVENNIWRTLFCVHDCLATDRLSDLGGLRANLLEVSHGYAARSNYDNVFGQTLGLYCLRLFSLSEPQMNMVTLKWLMENLELADERDAPIGLLLASTLKAFDSDLRNALLRLLQRDNETLLVGNTLAYQAEACSTWGMDEATRVQIADALATHIRSERRSISMADLRIASVMLSPGSLTGEMSELLASLDAQVFCRDVYVSCRSGRAMRLGSGNLPEAAIRLRFLVAFERAFGVAAVELDQQFRAFDGGTGEQGRHMLAAVDDLATRLSSSTTSLRLKSEAHALTLREAGSAQRRSAVLLVIAAGAMSGLYVSVFGVLAATKYSLPESAQALWRGIAAQATFHFFVVASVLAALAVRWQDLWGWIVGGRKPGVQR